MYKREIDRKLVTECMNERVREKEREGMSERGGKRERERAEAEGKEFLNAIIFLGRCVLHKILRCQKHLPFLTLATHVKF